MRKRHVRNSLDFRYLEYPQISLPLMESIQRIIIRAEILWQTLPTNGATEHSAQRYSVYNAAVDAKPYQPPCKLVHHHENPMCSQRCRLASEQIAAPQAVLYMAEKGEPGWTRTRVGPVMHAQDTANHILVDVDTKSQRDLLSNSWAAPVGIPPFHFHNSSDEFFLWSLWSRSTPKLSGEQYTILSFP